MALGLDHPARQFSGKQALRSSGKLRAPLQSEACQSNTMTQPATRSTTTVGETLAEALGLNSPLSQVRRALSESPAMRRLSESLEALEKWAEQPEVRAAFNALRDIATVDERLQAYRRRWETEQIPISILEAKHALLCLAYASFDEPVDAAEFLAHELGNAPDDEALAQYIEIACHSPEHWDALAQYRQTLLQTNGEVPAALATWPNRPRPPSRRGRPPKRWFRDRILVPEAIRKLKGCGMHVTSAEGPCIAVAVADVFDLQTRNVAAIWERAPGRSEKRSRTLYADEPCVLCGAPTVPKWRAARFNCRCLKCAPEAESD